MWINVCDVGSVIDVEDGYIGLISWNIRCVEWDRFDVLIEIDSFGVEVVVVD